MANLGSLFEIPKWSSERQQQMEKIYLMKGIDLESIFYIAHEKTLSNPTPVTHRGKSFMSQTMNGNLIGTMKEMYPDHMEKDVHGRDFFSLDAQTRVYFKKLDNAYCPRNIPTNHVRQLNSGELLLGDTPITVLYAGFRLENDNIWDNITGCYLTELRDMHKVLWVSDLSDLASQMGGTTLPTVPVMPVNLPDDIIVKPKVRGTGELGNTADGAV
ncbi:hypothetical protein LX64_00687 [Chitinophaga skermanii]|uniref:Uncharacterized protein n=1 Tax=Chitinophaga skermanii TaxID=331697 RepID=A0A327R2L3_9BACT|nr:hypothetical protein [Chitinophaga skermanii]RAJ11079.1 hypothetical protein LX64_00687 [Chitinophaga skermanii]